MKAMKSVLFCATLLAFGTTAAVAEDFTFLVPVQITNLHPDITKGRVTCTVKKYKSSSSNDPVATWLSQEFNIVNGNFNGTLTIKFNAVSGSNPLDAKFWQCSMDLYSATQGWTWAGFQFDIYTNGGPYKFDNVNSVLGASGSIP